MFEWGWIQELDANQAVDELARARDLVLAAEAGRFLLAAHWADLRAPEFVEEARRELPGMPRVVQYAEDLPELDEFAGAELAAVSGMTTRAGEQLIRDALLVRHRHPLLWGRIQDGTARVWVASKVARRCAAAELDGAQTGWVDAETTPYLETLPTKRFFDLVEAKIIEADPTAAEARAKAEELRKYVIRGPVDEHGMRTLIARAHAGDISYVVAALDRIAEVLAAQGDHTSLEVRRATALRILANPARALGLLLDAAAEHADPRIETSADTGEDVIHDERPSGSFTCTVDTHGRPILADVEDSTGRPLSGLALTDLDLGESIGQIRGLADLLTTVGLGEPAVSSERGGTLLDPDMLASVRDALAEFDASVFDPLSVFHVHLTDTTLREGTGVVRVEELGPVVLGQVRDWLTHPMSPDHIQQQIRLRPVLDAAAIRPVDAYEHPGRMSELATIRTPYEVFPFGTRPSRRCENDHARAYVGRPTRKRRRRQGRSSTAPPGQTRLENNAKLGKRHHRIKTFGGWQLHHPEPGVYLWRTRHGHWLRVDAAGTHHLGRNTALDDEYARPTDTRMQPTS